ncbi:FMN-linked oxidoreductase [Clavulina sp. PMI_390]|nr:FMN-linked oxidoreductase [Clavulina sp. PMI_390]
MPSIAHTKLFQPFELGHLKLQHRSVLAPLTRYKASKHHVHGDLAVEYYSQRASTPGTLLIAEATAISYDSVGWRHAPGIWNDDQVAGWKRVTDAVHAKGSFIILQVFAMGRAAEPEALEEDGLGVIPVAPSAIPLSRYRDSPLHVLTQEEIAEYVNKYEHAAKNALAAGFDGIELHGANGYLIDEFLQDVSNQRTDKFGGSVENRARFPLQALDALVRVWGQERVGARFGPWSTFNEMRMVDPVPTFTYMIEEIKKRYPKFMYLHMIEPRIAGVVEEEGGPDDSNDFAYKIWAPRPYLRAGGFSTDPSKGIAAAEQEGVLVVFGRAFIANPDLPARVRKGIPFHPYNRDTFYLLETAEGYTDQPFAVENIH